MDTKSKTVLDAPGILVGYIAILQELFGRLGSKPLPENPEKIIFWASLLEVMAGAIRIAERMQKTSLEDFKNVPVVTHSEKERYTLLSVPFFDALMFTAPFSNSDEKRI